MPYPGRPAEDAIVFGDELPAIMNVMRDLIGKPVCARAGVDATDDAAIARQRVLSRDPAAPHHRPPQTRRRMVRRSSTQMRAVYREVCRLRSARRGSSTSPIGRSAVTREQLEAVICASSPTSLSRWPTTASDQAAVDAILTAADAYAAGDSDGVTELRRLVLDTATSPRPTLKGHCMTPERPETLRPPRTAANRLRRPSIPARLHLPGLRETPLPQQSRRETRRPAAEELRRQPDPRLPLRRLLAPDVAGYRDDDPPPRGRPMTRQMIDSAYPLRNPPAAGHHPHLRRRRHRPPLDPAEILAMPAR